MTDRTFADVWDLVAARLPDAPAQVHGDRRYTWQATDRRARGVAGALLTAGLEHQDKVAQYLYNGPEYLESVWAAFKAGLVPVNTNYRYTDDELVYLWDNADADAVVFDDAFTATVDRIRHRLPRVRLWLRVGGTAGDLPGWATAYEDAATGSTAEQTAAPAPRWDRSGDDLYLLYTGGTTGLPKGVMWRQADLFAVLNRTAKIRFPDDTPLEDLAPLLAGPGPVTLPACPLMHGTGSFTAFAAWSSGGCVVTLPPRAFDPVALLDTVERERVAALAIVGDAFGRPLLDVLDRDPSRWDLSSLRILNSSGVMWSAAVKAGLLRHAPHAILVDSLGSSEAVGLATSVTRSSQDAATARFAVSERTSVLTPDGRPVTPGSGEVGTLALQGPLPLGYYKDPDRSAATFRLIDGARWSIPGDFATVETDGTITLLGRGSASINTGGEKVFPEEVEEALKSHPAVHDAVVVGIPDQRFGERVVAVVVAGQGAGENLDEAAVIAHVRSQLAAYKAPRHILLVDDLARSPSGKADYPHWRTRATTHLTPS